MPANSKTSPAADMGSIPHCVNAALFLRSLKCAPLTDTFENNELKLRNSFTLFTPHVSPTRTLAILQIAESMNRLLHSLSLAFLLSAGSSCINAAPTGQVATDRLVNVPRRITIHDAEQHLDTKLIHEFSERRGTNRYDCMRFSGIEPPASFYFIFLNSQLIRIVNTPPFAYTNVLSFDKKTPWQKLLPIDPDERITVTMQQPDLSPSDVASRLSLDLQRKGKKTDSLNVLPAFIVTAPIWVALAPKAAAETKQVEAWKAQYNPLLISLGASVSEMQKVFGKPGAKVAGKADEIIYLYGHKNPPNVAAGISQSMVAVVLKESTVTRILSDHFFPTTWHSLVP